MQEDKRILEHTISASEASSSRRWERSIAWPACYLAAEIGPRPPGSKGEARAARFIRRELEGMGYQVEVQEFKSPVTNAWGRALDRLLILAGGLLFPVNRHLSYALVFAGFLSFLLERYGRCPFSCLAPRRRSENVVARATPQHGQGAPRLVIVAHLDSNRTAFYYRPGLANLYRALRSLEALSQGALFLLFTLAYGGHLLSVDPAKLDFLWRIGLALSLFPFLSFLAIISKAFSDRASPGGNFNGSGVAVLLELARLYSRHQPHEAELWFAFTGASDAEGRGVRELVRRHRRELRGVGFLVLEGVGRGFPACRSKEGPLPGFRPDRRLLKQARRVMETYAHYSGGTTRMRYHRGEAFHLLSRGHRALTVVGMEEGFIPRYWRWEKDDQANVDPRSLRLALDFVRALVDAVDHGGSGKKGVSAYRRSGRRSR